MRKKLYHRQKIFLSLLQAFEKPLASVDFQKYLFLYTQEFQTEPSYDFVPYKYGCFSFQSYEDKRRLIEFGYLANSEKNKIQNEDDDFIGALEIGEQQKILEFKNKYEKLSGTSLVEHIYKNYPYYAINSEIAQKVLADDEFDRVNSARPSQDEYKFFTIGYEGASIENYLNRLIKNNIKVLCDVRRNPYSRKYGFSRGSLKTFVENLGIKYMHFPQLGISSEKRTVLETQDDYDELFKHYERTTLKSETECLNKITSTLKKYKRIAITCFEAHVCQCHRSRVAEALTLLPEWEYQTEHI